MTLTTVDNYPYNKIQEFIALGSIFPYTGYPVTPEDAANFMNASYQLEGALLLQFHNVDYISPHQEAIDAFRKLANQSLPGKPTIPSNADRIQSVRIGIEEPLETVKAMGVDMRMLGSKMVHAGDEKYSIVEYDQNEGFEYVLANTFNFTQAVDGIGDSHVVITQIASCLGINEHWVQRIIDSVNLQKFGPGSSRNEFGKQIPPPGFKKAHHEIHRVLLAMGAPVTTAD